MRRDSDIVDSENIRIDNADRRCVSVSKKTKSSCDYVGAAIGRPAEFVASLPVLSAHS